MEDYTLPLWIYLAVLTVLIGGAVQKVTVVTWLGATVLVKLSVPVLFLVLICIWMCWRNQTTERLSALGKAVLITGCDSGFGNAAARTMDALGFQVFATVMDPEGSGAKELRKSCSSRLHLLQLDITQPQQVQEVLLQTSNRLGLRGLWGLVNNAGVCVNFGDARLSMMSDYTGCMEVNFFGTMSVTQAFLPLLLKEKGRIVTVSSPAGDMPFPFLSAYGASKAALNLYINTLRHELLPWGVNVSTILPSSYKTGQSSNEMYWDTQYKQLIQSLPPSLLEEYGEDYLNETRELFRSHARSASEDLSPVINSIVEALLAPRPLASYYAGPGVGLMYFIHTYLPTAVSDKFLQRLFVQKKLLPRILRKENELVIHSINNNNNEDQLAM